MVNMMENEPGTPDDNGCSTDLLPAMKLIEDLYVPKFESGFERPAVVSDYSDYLSSCDKKFEELCCCLPDDITYDKSFKRFISSAIILAGEHFSCNLWTTPNTLKLSKIFLLKLLNIIDCHVNITDVLIDNESDIFRKVLKQLRPKLLKDSWKNYPAAVTCYSWVLHHVESPYLSDCLTSIIPTALLLVDDFVHENRVLGLKCLEHIINNVSKTSLSWYSYDNVICKALEHLIYFKDEELIIEPLMMALISLMKTMHLQQTQIDLRQNQFDPVIDYILHNMMLEQKIKIRSVNAKMLPGIIRARSLGMLIHAKALLKVIDEYVLEPSSSFEGLEVLLTFIEICWPRICAHFNQIFLLVCKVYLGIKNGRYSDTCELKLMKIVNRLKQLCPDKIEERKTLISNEKFFPTLQPLFN